jgi:ABC-2 type transport system permease protein
MSTGLAHDVSVLAEHHASWAFSRGTMATTVLQPLLFLGIFYCTFHGMLSRQGIDFGSYTTPTIIVQALMFIAIASAEQLSAERSSGLFNRLRTAPINSWAIGLSRLLVVGAEAAVSTVILAAVGHIFGFRFTNGVFGAIGFFVIAVLFACALTLATAAIALTVRNGEALGALMHLPYLPLLVLSTGFVPAEKFPSWLRPVVEASPVSAVIDALRALSSGAFTAGPVVKAVAWCLAMSLILAAATARAFRKVDR